ncbi:hypothetical protein D3C72_1319380 [compost metagenome]
MNSLSKAFAISRASVVLPTPGGPHKIIEWVLPASNARRSGLPTPSRCVWPMTSFRVLGRKASAKGWRGAVEKRSAIMSYLIRMQKPRIAARPAHTQGATVLIVDDVGALGHDKLKVIGR